MSYPALDLATGLPAGIRQVSLFSSSVPDPTDSAGGYPFGGRRGALLRYGRGVRWKWLSSLSESVLRFGAKRSAAGTYEALRRAVVVGRPRNKEEAEELVLAALARRRSWRRIDQRTFECHYRGRTAAIQVSTPLDASELLMAISRAEMETFFRTCGETTLSELQTIGQREIERLVQRDS